LQKCFKLLSSQYLCESLRFRLRIPIGLCHFDIPVGSLSSGDSLHYRGVGEARVTENCLWNMTWKIVAHCYSVFFFRNWEMCVKVKSNQINIFINSSKEKKEIPLLKERKVRNKLTTYTIPAHYATQTNLLKSTLFGRHLKE